MLAPIISDACLKCQKNIFENLKNTIGSDKVNLSNAEN